MFRYRGCSPPPRDLTFTTLIISRLENGKILETYQVPFHVISFRKIKLHLWIATVSSTQLQYCKQLFFLCAFIDILEGVRHLFTPSAIIAVSRASVIGNISKADVKQDTSSNMNIKIQLSYFHAEYYLPYLHKTVTSYCI